LNIHESPNLEALSQRLEPNNINNNQHSNSLKEIDANYITPTIYIEGMSHA